MDSSWPKVGSTLKVCAKRMEDDNVRAQLAPAQSLLAASDKPSGVRERERERMRRSSWLALCKLR